MTIVNNIRIVRFSSKDNSSRAELDYFLTRQPQGNIQLYFDDKLLIDIVDRDRPDSDDMDFKLPSSFNPNNP
jgi:hypothetical protein